MQNRTILHYGFFSILLFQGFMWFRSGIEKIIEATFPHNLGVTLEKFASENPHGFYKYLLTERGIPNAEIIGNMVMWAEVVAGFLIIIAAFYLLIHSKGNRIFEMLFVTGLIIGFFLNLNFWLASGWMSPSASGLNLLMMVVEFVGVAVVLLW